MRQGAGLLNIDAATNATTRVTPGKLPLGETEGAPVTRRILIQNKGSVGLTYDSGHKGAFSTDPTGSPLYLPQGGTVTFAPTSLYVQAGGTGNVDVTVTAPDGLPDRDLFGGYILLRATLYGSPVLGWSSMIVSLYFIGGVIIAVLGIAGIYISKIFDETKRRPLYIVRRTTFGDR